jgi:pectate lyase
MHASLLLSLIPAAFAAPAALAAKGSPVGFAAGTTGGGNGASTTVTSCSALSSALKSGGNIVINGMLSDCGVLEVSSDTTVLGSGANSGMFLPSHDSARMFCFLFYCLANNALST